MEAVNKVTEQEVSAALLPKMAPDAVLCTDGHVTYEAIPKITRITHFALNGGKQSRCTPKTHHINTVNALDQPLPGLPSAHSVGHHRRTSRPMAVGAQPEKTGIAITSRSSRRSSTRRD